jgi:hypothetical protein
MTDNSDTSIKASLKERVFEWLVQQGYPLEMLVSQAFQKADFYVTQSSFYKDIETGDAREIDVIAYKKADYGDDGIEIQVSCCIECKLGGEKPWILFRPHNPVGTGQEFEYLAFTLPTTNSELGDKLLNRGIEQEKIQALKMLRLLPVGYGMARATFVKEKGPDIPYEAMNGTVKAAIYLLNEHQRQTEFSNKKQSHIVFPVIVVDTNLFECYLDDTNQMVVNEIEYCSLVWSNPKAGYSSFVIFVFTKPALPKLVDYMSEVSDAFLRRGELLIDDV